MNQRIIFVLFLIKYSYSVDNCPCECNNAIMREVQHQLGLLNGRIETLSVRLELQNEIIRGNHVSLKQCASLSLTEEEVSPRRPSNCVEATSKTHKSGLYSIHIDMGISNLHSFLVTCDDDSQGGGWTVIQRRLDGSVDFYRTWAEYKIGFGRLDGEFFIGLDKLHALTTQSPQELLIIMEDFDKTKKFAKYSAFAIGNESEAYILNVLGNYSGDAGDSLSQHRGHKFTTKDVDNDDEAGKNCAEMYTGAWWYYACHASNLNGKYLHGEYAKELYAQGVVWVTWRGHYYSHKSVQIMIRPQRV